MHRSILCIVVVLAGFATTAHSISLNNSSTHSSTIRASP